jgi:nitrate/nitrite-specific signal transduction histidine kinase
MGVYCLPVQYNNDLLALIRFQVHPKETLSSDQAFILDSLGIDMALAVRVGKDRKAYDDLQVAEASLAERRHLSHLLHDNLGQNLAYLRFKLGQIVASQPVDTSQAMARDLNRLWDVAEKSYDIVRGTLETITPRMSNDLTNILMDLARSTTQQANMQLSFKSNGEPGEVTSPVRRELYYVFREVFNNIQRHASASKVDVLLNWGQHDVAVQIFDDGVGFEPGRVDTERHFGYRIIQDRLAEIHGDLNLESAAGQGTKVTICVPR